MSDWIGLAFILVLVALGLVGLKVLSVKKIRSEEEFEKGAAEGSSMGGVFKSAANGMLNPGAKRGEKAVVETRQSSRRKKRGDGSRGNRKIPEN